MPLDVRVDQSERSVAIPSLERPKERADDVLGRQCADLSRLMRERYGLRAARGGAARSGGGIGAGRPM
jgi:hypothetical protein